MSGTLAIYYSVRIVWFLYDLKQIKPKNSSTLPLRWSPQYLDNNFQPYEPYNAYRYRQKGS